MKGNSPQVDALEHSRDLEPSDGICGYEGSFQTTGIELRRGSRTWIMIMVAYRSRSSTDNCLRDLDCLPFCIPLLGLLM